MAEGTTRQNSLIQLLRSQVAQAHHQRAQAAHNHLASVHKLSGEKKRQLLRICIIFIISLIFFLLPLLPFSNSPRLFRAQSYTRST